MRRLADVEGFLPDEEDECFFKAARGWTGRGAVVEIGSCLPERTLDRAPQTPLIALRRAVSHWRKSR